MQRVVIALGLIVGFFFVVRAVVELLTIDCSDPSSYAHDWGGPSLARVVLVGRIDLGRRDVAVLDLREELGVAQLPGRVGASHRPQQDQCGDDEAHERQPSVPSRRRWRSLRPRAVEVASEFRVLGQPKHPLPAEAAGRPENRHDSDAALDKATPTNGRGPT
jgi:hypothetical protein